MNDPWNEKEEKITKHAFEALRKLRAPEDLANRIMVARVANQIEGEKSKASGVWFWKLSSALGAVATMTLLFLYSQEATTLHHASTHENLSVQIDIQDLQQELMANQVKYARIDLPDGVEFVSERFPEIKHRRSLVVKWSNENLPSEIPFLVKGTQTGSKILTVHFFGEGDRKVSTRKMKVRFHGAGGADHV